MRKKLVQENSKEKLYMEVLVDLENLGLNLDKVEY